MPAKRVYFPWLLPPLAVDGTVVPELFHPLPYIGIPTICLSKWGQWYDYTLFSAFYERMLTKYGLFPYISWGWYVVVNVQNIPFNTLSCLVLLRTTNYITSRLTKNELISGTSTINPVLGCRCNYLVVAAITFCGVDSPGALYSGAAKPVCDLSHAPWISYCIKFTKSRSLKEEVEIVTAVRHCLTSCRRILAETFWIFL